ncbi:MAG: hypothetical protein M1831_000577 [Alyxoria varia]|nr:MAG: hypothetical protein M1831_000577 [Alyxoria varia]
MSTTELYTVGWICALPTEHVAVCEFLDEEHPPPLEVPINDRNDYTLGKIGKHYVVIAVLPDGEYGTSSAANVARDMVRTFLNLRFGLMVGVGGGVSSPKHDIRLGDVVVSSPTDGYSGVLQYDYGKSIQAQVFQQTGVLDQPPPVLRTAVSGLKAQHERKGHGMKDAVNVVITRPPRLRKAYRQPDAEDDRLYRAHVLHPQHDNRDCAKVCGSDEEKVQRRNARTAEDDDPAIHYGLIASGNCLMKDAELRDSLAQRHSLLCFEMEAAGLMNHFPCLVVRGICDYSDTHKNKDWQGYAAMTAAAYTKELLCRVAPETVQATERLSEIIGKVYTNLGTINTAVQDVALTQYQQIENYASDGHHKCHQTFKTSNYESFKDENPDRVSGTCLWALQHTRYRAWRESQMSDLLWISADPGCGKSVLAKTLFDDAELSLAGGATICRFFFQENEDQNNLERNFNVIPEIRLRGEEENETLRREIDLIIRQRVEVLAKEVHMKEGVRRQLEKKLLDMEHRTYLWLYLAIDAIYRTYEQSLYPEEESIETLPSSVQNAYENILAKIVKERNHKAREVLGVVAGARRPLSVEELAYALGLAWTKDATDLEAIAIRVDLERWIRRYCGLFIFFSDSRAYLIHQTAKEFLVCSNQLQGQAWEWCFPPVEINGLMLRICITALLLRDFDEFSSKPLFPWDDTARNGKSRLLRYCAENWTYHLHVAYTNISSITENKIDLLHNVDDNRCGRWFVFAWKGEAIGWTMPSLNQVQPCAFIGHWKWLKRQLRSEDSRLEDRDDEGRTALYLASFRGLCETTGIVRMLLDKGAEVNAQNDMWKSMHGYNARNALQAASFKGHLEVVRILLDEGADVNTGSGHCGNALQAASWKGHREVVQMLLSKGANVNAQGGQLGSALQAASFRGLPEIVQMLLDDGADVNAQGGQFGTALKVASFRGLPEIVQMLLGKGAEVNMQGGLFVNALEAASSTGYQEVVQMLLGKGADVSARSGK